MNAEVLSSPTSTFAGKGSSAWPEHTAPPAGNGTPKSEERFTEGPRG